MRKSKQRERVLELLQRGPVTRISAVEEIGCFELAARIVELKSLGHRIVSKTVAGKNRFGDAVRYSEYTWVGGPMPRAATA